MKKLFIIFFLFSVTCFSQIKKDSIRRFDSIKKVELKNNIASLQLKLDSILKNEQKEKKEEKLTVNSFSKLKALIKLRDNDRQTNKTSKRTSR